MTLTGYLLNGALVALVIVQLRGRRLTVRTLIWPVAVVGYVATQYIHGIPAASGNVTLVTAGALTGLVLGTGAGLATGAFRRVDGAVVAKAGALAAVLWVAGIGARIAFSMYATHGGGPAIARFSAAHHITSVQAWVTCLVLMALVEVISRTAVIAVRYWRLGLTSDAGPRESGARPGALSHAMIGLRGRWS